jgi:methylmalonyl-CoA mutase C-terminal domain/subunit
MGRLNMGTPQKKIKVLISKVGFDGHDRGAKVIATVLRDAGMEVIYLGKHQTPESIVSVAVQEDVDVIGISYLAGQHLNYTPQIVKIMKRNKLGDVLLIAGGVIPREDIPKLKEMGIAEVFPPGTLTSQIVNYMKAKLPSPKQ